jgi:hypothetical protein
MAKPLFWPAEKRDVPSKVPRLMEDLPPLTILCMSGLESLADDAALHPASPSRRVSIKPADPLIATEKADLPHVIRASSPHSAKFGNRAPDFAAAYALRGWPD